MSKVEVCIELKNINQFFGEKHILKNISLSIPKGAIYGLLGPSGCGKTTTVKIAAGIFQSTSGEAFLLGERLPKLSSMNKVGYMAQSDALYMDLTAKENMEFFGQLYRIEKQTLQERIWHTLDLVHMSEDAHKPVAAFSGGMKRRLSLAMALLHSPEVLILDEPTVGIDPLLRRDIWDELYIMAEAGITILVTTHVMDEAAKCTTLSMMRNGKLIATGSPAEIQETVNASNLEEAFLRYSEEGGSSYGN